MLFRSYYDIGKSDLHCSQIKINRPSTEDEILANRKYMTILEALYKDATLKAEEQICKEILYFATEKNEQYDGLGFPNCLKGAAISPIGKILAVADYIARKMTDCMAQEELIKKLKMKIGKKFDPTVIELAVGVVEELYRQEREALPEETQEFRSIQMLYQPVCEAGSDVVKMNVGHICLNDKKRGVVMPSFYIPVAEKNGRMMDITKFGFEFLLQDMVKNRLSPEEMSRTFAVHVSTECLLKASFLQFVKKMIREYAINPQRLVFEVDAASIDLVDTKLAECLKEYKDLGIKLAIDNYGTDQGSLVKLQELEPNYIKIDRSFIDQICDNRKTYEIVKSIIKLAKELEIRVIAKGVDNEQQMTMLRDMKCFYMQGRLFGEPEYLWGTL